LQFHHLRVFQQRPQHWVRRHPLFPETPPPVFRHGLHRLRDQLRCPVPTLPAGAGPSRRRGEAGGPPKLRRPPLPPRRPPGVHPPRGGIRATAFLITSSSFRRTATSSRLPFISPFAAGRNATALSRSSRASDQRPSTMASRPRVA